MNLLIKTLNNNLYKIVELALLSSILPYLVLVLKFYNLVLPILWLVTLYCIIIFYLKENNINYKLKNIFNINRLVLIKIIIRWIIFSAILLLITYYFFNEKFFIIQKNNPEILWKIMLLYPIFSALPQEFIFCKFFFFRYKSIFKSNLNLTIASAVLSLIGGFLFANTYRKHRSLLLVSIEHGLYGNTLFFVGLGWYFWGGSLA